MSNSTQGRPRLISSRSTSSSTGNRISTISSDSGGSAGSPLSALLSPIWKRRLEKEILPGFLRASRWFPGKSRLINTVRIRKVIDLAGGRVSLVLLDVIFEADPKETYLILLAPTFRDRADFPAESIVDSYLHDGRSLCLIDGLSAAEYRKELFDFIVQQRRKKVAGGHLVSRGDRRYRLKPQDRKESGSRLLRVDQSNTSIVYAEKYYLKLFRRLQYGEHPEAEMLSFLSGGKNPPAAPVFVASLEWQEPKDRRIVLGVLQSFIQARSDAWSVVTAAAREEIKRSRTASRGRSKAELAQGLVEHIRALGRLTAELHRALSSGKIPRGIRPHECTGADLRKLASGMEADVVRSLGLLARVSPQLTVPSGAVAADLLDRRDAVCKILRSVRTIKPDFRFVRIHGDYHLGQILVKKGGDLAIIDFEGEPVRSLSERRRTMPAMVDVAGMLRSLHYAFHAAHGSASGPAAHHVQKKFDNAARGWYEQTSRIFLRSYFADLRSPRLTPSSDADRICLLKALCLRKAFYELEYEINNRPSWVIIPLLGISALLAEEQGFAVDI